MGNTRLFFRVNIRESIIELLLLSNTMLQGTLLLLHVTVPESCTKLNKIAMINIFLPYILSSGSF